MRHTEIPYKNKGKPKTPNVRKIAKREAFGTSSEKALKNSIFHRDRCCGKILDFEVNKNEFAFSTSKETGKIRNDFTFQPVFGRF